MERAEAMDKDVLLWLNGGVGRFPWLDSAVRYLVSDYLVPALLGLLLLGMWFGAKDGATRERHQRGVLAAMIGMGVANLVTFVMNHHIIRDRPFVDHDLTLLFYYPTDPSFPANPAVVAFALAAGIWRGSRRIGLVAYALAGLWGLSRVYAGVFYPSDVVAGALLGMLVTWFVCLILALIEPVPSLVLQAARRFYLA